MTDRELKLRNELVQIRVWIRHWKDDVAAGMKPTTESLTEAETRITTLLNETKD